MMFTQQEVADYYNTTLVHYERWWNLRKSLSLHYGIWENETQTFAESLTNTNRVLMEVSKITETDTVLDAGCGVGGAALYLSSTKNAQVTGITLSLKQVHYARQMAKEKNLERKVSFQVMDYTQTHFENESFDVVWACESISSAPNKQAFINEAYRLLKKGGRLILSDFFLTTKDQEDTNNWIEKWMYTWSMSGLESGEDFEALLSDKGFIVKENLNYTEKIRKSAQRLYYAALLGAIPSEVYNLFHPNVSRFSKSHYKSGYYQFKALQENLWNYRVLLATKAL